MTGNDVRLLRLGFSPDERPRTLGHGFYLTRAMRGYVRSEYRTVRRILTESGVGPVLARYLARRAAYARAAWCSHLINTPPSGESGVGSP